MGGGYNDFRIGGEFMNKKIPWFNILIVVFLITLIGLLIYNVIIVKESKQTNENPNQTEQKEEQKNDVEKEDLGEELSLSDNRVIGLMEPFVVMNDSLNTHYFGYFYEKEKNEISSIPDDVKIAIAMYSMKSELEEQIKSAPVGESADIIVPAQRLETEMKKIYGNISYNHVSLKQGGCGYSSFTYDGQKNLYTQPEPACGGTLLPTYLTKVTSATLYKDRLEIIQAIAYQAFEVTNQAPVAILYNNKTEMKKIHTFDLNEEIKIDNHIDQSMKYKFTFKRNSDGTFSFVSANRKA